MPPDPLGKKKKFRRLFFGKNNKAPKEKNPLQKNLFGLKLSAREKMGKKFGAHPLPKMPQRLGKNCFFSTILNSKNLFF